MGSKIEIKANLKDFQSLKSKLKSLSNFYYLERGNSISVGYIERRDLQGNPKEFFILEFKPDGISIEYSDSDTENPALRKWNILRKVMPILSMVANEYNLDPQSMMEIMNFAIEDLLSSIPESTKAGLLEKEELKAKITQLERKIASLEKDKKELEKELFKVAEENEKLKFKLRKYESMSDEMLKKKIMDWIKESGGEFDIGEFAKTYKVPEARIHEMLEELIKEKYIKPL
ncbi:MAG: hypothetical protein GXN92_01020 [Candidatus Micrarchaeota archaeon]|nr:hypothetical protein [Candidatus Micrarchaeota archaeon]